MKNKDPVQPYCENNVFVAIKEKKITVYGPQSNNIFTYRISEQRFTYLDELIDKCVKDWRIEGDFSVKEKDSKLAFDYKKQPISQLASNIFLIQQSLSRQDSTLSSFNVDRKDDLEESMIQSRKRTQVSKRLSFKKEEKTKQQAGKQTQRKKQKQEEDRRRQKEQRQAWRSREEQPQREEQDSQVIQRRRDVEEIEPLREQVIRRQREEKEIQLRSRYEQQIKRLKEQVTKLQREKKMGQAHEHKKLEKQVQIQRQDGRLAQQNLKSQKCRKQQACEPDGLRVIVTLDNNRIDYKQDPSITLTEFWRDKGKLMLDQRSLKFAKLYRIDPNGPIQPLDQQKFINAPLSKLAINSKLEILVKKVFSGA